MGFAVTVSCCGVVPFTGVIESRVLDAVAVKVTGAPLLAT
jgi:hypothetical protein